MTNPVVQGALVGALSAASVDYAAFRSWKRWQDVLVYDWAVASWRIFQGAVIGAIAASGLGALLGG